MVHRVSSLSLFCGRLAVSDVLCHPFTMKFSEWSDYTAALGIRPGMSAFISTLPSAVIPTVSMPPICHVSDAIQRDGSVCVSVYCFLSSQGWYYVVHVGKVIRFNADSIIDPHTLYLLSYHYERLYRKTTSTVKLERCILSSISDDTLMSNFYIDLFMIIIDLL